jgi:hypothetical protein
MSPVLNHEVHAVTKIRSDKPYGCHSRTGMSNGYIAFDRQYRHDGTFVVTQKFIPHALSEACRYDLSSKDPRCSNCSTKKDIKYLSDMSIL